MKLISTKVRMTDAEYRANLAGLNTFFGAVLGFVISGIENLGALRFSYVLLILSGVVISILYISASAHRVAYSIYTLALVLALPWLVEPVLRDAVALPAKLQPTLLVWAIITIFVEFMPRARSPEPETAA
jgi:hypothetical protein